MMDDFQNAYNIWFLKPCRYEGPRTVEALAEFVNNEGGLHLLCIICLIPLDRNARLCSVFVFAEHR